MCTAIANRELEKLTRTELIRTANGGSRSTAGEALEWAKQNKIVVQPNGKGGAYKYREVA